jgi:tetratricopeptide (TPR) repeat protein
MRSILALLPAFALLTSQASAQQILWQRSLDDALALVRAESRPLLIAVSMDGESASDRIVRELYRDPKFVETTRRCVCLVASLYRHAPRDYDDAGRRIPCPRFGEVTCGEHMALESILNKNYLADGERVAPRHALVMPDGRKVWDLSLSFDLRDIERDLVSVLRDAPQSRPAASEPALAKRRDHRGRAQLEELLAKCDAAALGPMLAELALHGDRGSLPALHVAARRLGEGGPSPEAAFLEAARTLGLQADVAAILRAIRDPAALSTLARSGDDSAATRTRLLGVRAQPEVALYAALSAAGVVTAWEPAGVLPRPNEITDGTPPEQDLANLFPRLKEAADAPGASPEAVARFAKTALDLGRHRLEEDPSAGKELFRLAESTYQRALEASPDVAAWWIERARSAYFRGSFDDEARFGREALERLTGSEDPPDPAAIATALGAASRPADRIAAAPLLNDSRVVEALRWIGDGGARLITGDASLDDAAITRLAVEAGRALSIVAISPFSDADDWIAWASFWGSFGLAREEMLILRAGAMRLPASTEVRAALNTVLWNGGRIDLAPEEAESVARRNPACAEALWFCGQAWTLAGDSRRRQEQAGAAVAAYERARSFFATAARFKPDYADDCLMRSALACFGSGMAHLLENRREAAADMLVEGAKLSPKAATVRDGLDSDALDLVDRIFEWREAGASQVDPQKLLDRLSAADPGNAFWALAISDALLREALRADGRNPVRTERETVDAGGRPIRMMLGVPNEEGDGYLARSVAIARAGLTTTDSDETRRALAQGLTFAGERLILRDRASEARAPLAEAAGLMKLDPAPATDADAAAIAAPLRKVLGEARPRWRTGR